MKGVSDKPILAVKPSAGATGFFARLTYSVAIPIVGGAGMGISVFIFSWLVDVLLLSGIRHLYPGRLCVFRLLAAPVLNACYGVLSLQRWFPPLATPAFALVVVSVTGMVAFGVYGDGLRNSGLYLLLHLAIAGLLQPEQILSPWPLLLASTLLLALCALGFPERTDLLVPVELSYGTTCLRVTALRDTGNTLRDPITGKPILILGADATQALTGLTAQQLRSPLETMGSIPGLRLIPYHAIGGGGMLLALQLPMVRIDNRRVCGLVAFAPEILSKEGKFQALTGGVI